MTIEEATGSQVQSLQISLKNVVPSPDNYNKHDASQLNKLRGSLRAFGYVRTAVVKEPATEGAPYELIAGHGIIEAAKLEWGSDLSLEFRVVPPHWEPQMVRAYLVADNELQKLSSPDNVQLAALWQEIQNYDPELADVTGLDQAAFEDLLADIEAGLDGEGGEGAEKGIDSDGSLLALLNVTMDDPKYQPNPGDIWRLGPHYLYVGDPVTEWIQFTEILDTADNNEEGLPVLFVPYAGPFVPNIKQAKTHIIVMVQPEQFTAGHILGCYEAWNGDGSVWREGTIHNG